MHTPTRAVPVTTDVSYITRLMRHSLLLKTLLGLLMTTIATTARAEIKTQDIDYKDGNVELQGFLAYDDARQQPAPGVLIVHEWWGNNEYSRERAKQLAELGYVAFALDMFGKGVKAENPQDA